MGKLGNLIVEVGADATKLDADLDAAEGRVEKKGNRIGQKFAGGALLGLAAIGAAAFKASEDINTAYGTIQAGTGATGEQLLGLQASFDTLFGQTTASAELVSSAIADLNTRFGLTGDALEETALKAIQYSEATGGDGVAAMDNIGRAMSFFNIEASQAGDYFDRFVAASQASGIEIEKLSGLTQTYGSVLQTAGFSLDESVALMSQMHMAGVDVSRVMPGLNRAFREASEAGMQGKDVFEALVPALRNADSETEALRIATELLGAEGATRFVAFARQGDEAGKAVVTAMENASGATETMYGHSVTAADKVEMMKIRVGEFAGGLANTVGPMATFGASLGTGALGMAQMATAMKGVSLQTAIFTTAQTAKSVALGVSSTAMYAAGAALRFMLGPAGLVITAIGALTAAAIYLWKNWDEIWPKVKSAFEGPVNFITGLYSSKLGWLLPGGALVKGISYISEVWGIAWDWIKEKFQGVAERILDIAGPVLGLFGVEVPDALEDTSETAELELPKVETAAEELASTAKSEAVVYVQAMSDMETATTTMSTEGKSALDELRENWLENKNKIVEYADESFEEVGYVEEGYKTLKEQADATAAAVKAKTGEIKDDTVAMNTNTETPLADIASNVGDIDTAVSDLETTFGDARDNMPTVIGELRDGVSTPLGDMETDVADIDTAVSDMAANIEAEAGPEGIAADLAKLEETTGVHTSNIVNMYQAAGVAISESWETMLNALDGRIAASVASWNSAQPGGSTYDPLANWASNADVSQLNEEGHYSLSYDAEGNYVGFGGTHDVQGRDDEGNRTGKDNFVGLFPGYQGHEYTGAPPTLPGQGDPDWVRRQDAEERRKARARERARERERRERSGDRSTDEHGDTYGAHAGGIFTNPTRALLAEVEPEIVLPLSRLGATMRAAFRDVAPAMSGGVRAGAMGGDIHIHVNEGAYVFDDFVDAAADAVVKARLRGYAV